MSARQRFVQCAAPRGLHRISYLQWGDPNVESVHWVGTSMGGLIGMAPSFPDIGTAEKYIRAVSATCEQMQQRGPKAKVVEIPGVGHAPTLMHDDQIKIVREFLVS